MGSREDQVARIAQMERIHSMESGLPGQPGIQSIGTDSAPDTTGPVPGTPTGPQDNVSLLQKGLNVLGKAAQYPRDVVAGPLTGAVISAVSGKPAYSNEDLGNAYNPTTTKTFPSTHEMLRRTGMSDSPSLSDMLEKIPETNRSPLLQLAKIAGKHIYADPTQDNPWYQPVKGGALDPTAASAYDFATNPLNWLSAKQMVSSASKVPTISEAALNAKKGQEGAAVLEAMKNQPAPIAAPPEGIVGKALEKSGNAINAVQPSSIMEALGKKLYSALLQPVENQGDKFGKADVADELFKAGIKTPAGLSDKASNASDALMNARNSLLKTAGENGAVPSMERAMAPAQAKIAAIRGTQDPIATATANAIEPTIQQYLDIPKGTPEVPASSTQVPSPVLDAQGRPIMSNVETPGTPAVPGKVVSPLEASGYKSSLYNSMPSTQYNEAVKTSLGNQLRGAMAKGLKDEVESSATKGLGPQGGSAVKDLNETAGKLLSTRQGQLTAQNQASRLANRIISPTGSDSAFGSIAGAMEGNPEATIRYMALKHALDAIRYGSMPVGYGLRKAAESPLGGLLDMSLRNNAINSNLSSQGEKP